METWINCVWWNVSWNVSFILQSTQAKNNLFKKVGTWAWKALIQGKNPSVNPKMRVFCHYPSKGRGQGITKVCPNHKICKNVIWYSGWAYVAWPLHGWSQNMYAQLGQFHEQIPALMQLCSKEHTKILIDFIILDMEHR